MRSHTHTHTLPTGPSPCPAPPHAPSLLFCAHARRRQGRCVCVSEQKKAATTASRGKAGGGDRSSEAGKCPKCLGSVPSKEWPAHVLACVPKKKGAAKTVRWIWGDARLGKSAGSNEKIEENVSMLMAMLDGAPEWEIVKETADTFLQLTVRVFEEGGEEGDGDVWFQLVFRYGCDWPASMSVGLGAKSHRLLPLQWNEVALAATKAAQELQEQIDEDMEEADSFVWLLLQSMRERLTEIVAQFRSNLHDKVRGEAVDDGGCDTRGGGGGGLGFAEADGEALQFDGKGTWNASSLAKLGEQTSEEGALNGSENSGGTSPLLGQSVPSTATSMVATLAQLRRKRDENQSAQQVLHAPFRRSESDASDPADADAASRSPGVMMTPGRLGVLARSPNAGGGGGGGGGTAFSRKIPVSADVAEAAAAAVLPQQQPRRRKRRDGGDGGDDSESATVTPSVTPKVQGQPRTPVACKPLDGDALEEPLVLKSQPSESEPSSAYGDGDGDGDDDAEGQGVDDAASSSASDDGGSDTESLDSSTSSSSSGSSSGSTSDDSSSSGDFAALTKKGGAAKKKKEMCFDEEDSSNADARESKAKPGAARACVGGKARVVTITPKDRRAQIALRSALASVDADEEVREQVVAMLEMNGVLLPSLPPDQSTKVEGDDKGFSDTLTMLLAKGVIPAPAAAASTAGQSSIRSWYKEQFITVKTLGEGGQGRVDQVQNKVDGMFYAVKRVDLPQNHVPPGKHTSGAEMKRKRYERYRYVMAEIQTLARLSHQYIVRYFVAWFEEEPLSAAGAEKSPIVSPARGSGAVTSSFGFNGDEDECDDDSDGSDRSQDSAAASATKTMCYIQMEYCYQETLRQGIDRRVFTSNARGDECGFKILWQLLKCVSYIHEKGVIHRDLKPENIFFDLMTPTGGEYYEGDIKVGDFGLVAATQDGEDDGVSSDTRKCGNHSSGIGTPLYCAPEQMVGGSYNERVDEYSVGIITFEMFSGFTSNHERVSSLMSLRKTGKVPPGWSGRQIHQNLPMVIERLADRDPRERISAEDLLDCDWLPKPRQHEDMLAAVQLFIDEKGQMSKLLQKRYMSDPNTLNSSDWMYQEQSLRRTMSGAPQVRGLLSHDGSSGGSGGASMAPLCRSPVNHLSRSSLLSATETRCHVKETLSDQLKRMGAWELDVPYMIPSNTVIKDQPAMRCLDDAGNLFVIPKNPAVCFARYLSRPQARRLPLPMRRFGVHKIPTSIVDSLEVACFDVLTKAEAPEQEVDAELLLTLSSTLNGFQLPPHQRWVVKINHRKLLDVLEKVCRSESSAPNLCVGEVMTKFHQHSSRPKQFGEALGLQKLAASLVELLSVRKLLGVGHNQGGNHGKTGETNSTFLQTAGRLGVKHLLLKAIESDKHKHHTSKGQRRQGMLGHMPEDVRSAAAEALIHLHNLEIMLMDLEFQRDKVYIEFDMTYVADHTIYSGIMWGVQVGTEDRRCKESQLNSPLVGVGGRYTHFLETMRDHYGRIAALDKEAGGKSGDDLHQVPSNAKVSGGYLCITGIAESMVKDGRKSKTCKTGGTDELVFVCMDHGSYDGLLLLRIAAELRDAGVPADYQLDPTASVATLQDTCKDAGIAWMLIPTNPHRNVESASHGAHTMFKFKLKNLATGVLRKNKENREEILEGHVGSIARMVQAHLHERRSATGHDHHDSPFEPHAHGHPSHGTHAREPAPPMKMYNQDGRAPSDQHSVLSAIDSTFRNTPPSKVCIISPLPLVDIRQVVSHLYSSSVLSVLQDTRWRQLAEQCRVRASLAPLLLLHSEPDMQFEILVSSNLKVGAYDGTSSASRGDRQSKKRDERKKAKNMQHRASKGDY